MICKKHGATMVIDRDVGVIFERADGTSFELQGDRLKYHTSQSLEDLITRKQEQTREERA